jgi:nucleotide-binding universal stress UspA family protein
LIRSIVVGTDGSDTAKHAVKEATELAKGLAAELHLVSGYEAQEGRRVQAAGAGAESAAWAGAPDAHVQGLLDEAAALARMSGVEAQLHPCREDAADALIRIAEETKADVIVVGNKGMTGSRRFLLGSVPNKVSHHAPCSVLIVRTA